MRDLRWVKSTRSNGGQGNACVEHATDRNAAYIRDSKNPRGPVLVVSHSAWSAFTETIRTGNLT